eukprot:COSAG05_NODE_5850_length_1073_cov_10.696099_1_plen_52_part_00
MTVTVTVMVVVRRVARRSVGSPSVHTLKGVSKNCRWLIGGYVQDTNQESSN